MKIRCIVIDDEPVALEKMQKYVGQTPYLELVAACDNPIDALKVLSEEEVDAIFTDINMLGLNGLEFVSSLSQCPLVVFITAYTGYAVDSYKVGAVDYIVKPYGLKEFQRAADKVRLQYDMMRKCNVTGQNHSIFIRADYKWVNIKTQDIRYIQGMSDYMRIFIEGQAKPLLTYATFSHMMNILPSGFLQVHRSWIVNLEQIKEIERSRIVMDKDTYIPIGDAYKENLMQYLQKCSVGRQGNKF